MSEFKGVIESSFVGRWLINILLIVAVVGVATYSRQVALVTRDQNCVRVESIKALLREQENEDYAHLHRNLKLLNVKETPEVLALARREHETKLARLKKLPC